MVLIGLKSEPVVCNLTPLLFSNVDDCICYPPDCDIIPTKSTCKVVKSLFRAAGSSCKRLIFANITWQDN